MSSAFKIKLQVSLAYEIHLSLSFRVKLQKIKRKLQMSLVENNFFSKTIDSSLRRH